MANYGHETAGIVGAGIMYPTGIIIAVGATERSAISLRFQPESLILFGGAIRADQNSRRASPCF